MIKRNRIGDFILTYTGKEFYPLDPDPAELDIVDIAHALSNICRFTGHTRSFYSVAEHAVHVSRLVSPENALWGLLHDAPEAYICDVARPIKNDPSFVFYHRIESRLMDAIASRFGLYTRMPEEVRRADDIMLAIEGLSLMPWHECWVRMASLIPDDCPIKEIKPMQPYQAERAFLERFDILTDGKRFEERGGNG